MTTLSIQQPDTTILEIRLHDRGASLVRKEPDGLCNEHECDFAALEQVAAGLFANAMKAASLDYLILAADYSEIAQKIVDHIGGARA